MDMTPAEKTKFIAGWVSLAVYVAVAWVGAKLLDIHFWRALIVLLVTRAFFGLVELTAVTINWRLFARRTTVRGFIEVLRTNNFPQRFNQDDAFLSYLARVESGQYPETLQRAAREFEQVLAAIESQGIMAGMRIHAASELALEAYSPKASAPAKTL